MLLREYSSLFLPQTCAYKREFSSFLPQCHGKGQFPALPKPRSFKRALGNRSTLGWGWGIGQISTRGCLDAKQAQSQELLSWSHLTCQPCFSEPGAPEMPCASPEHCLTQHGLTDGQDSSFIKKQFISFCATQGK